jgi:hypothetical protein
MSRKVKPELAKVAEREKRQERLLKTYKKHERWMKWVIIGLIILVLLLILLAGYATDWTRGLNKDSSYKSTPLATSLDAVSGEGDTDTANQVTNGTGTTTRTTNGQSNNSTNTAKETTNNSTTTVRETTTNNNNNPTDPSTPSNALINLYTETNAGDNIDGILDLANGLGLTIECQNDILIQTCRFIDGDLTITTKNLLGTGIITSITKNF